MSRQDVLALLREQEGAFVSGEEISHRLGLSRAAIWKAVDAPAGGRATLWRPAPAGATVCWMRRTC